jgi:hypothetical protein
MTHTEKYGITERVSYSRTQNVLDIPNLIAIQTDSYDWFIKQGIRDVFDDISPIKDYSENMKLEFLNYRLDEAPKYSEQECKDRDMNYSTILKVDVRLTNNNTGEVKEQEVFMGEIPLMTENGTFIINGAERVIVSQLVRSPGVYYGEEIDESGNKLFSSTVIPNRGAWIEYDTDTSGAVNVRIDKTRKLPITTMIRALLFETNEEMIEHFGDIKELHTTLEKDISKSYQEAILEIYRKLKPGDPATVESGESLLHNLFFDPKRYDLAKVGRYKFNKKLALRNRIFETTLAQDIFKTDKFGEMEKIASVGDFVTEKLAKEIEDAGYKSVTVMVEDKKVIVTGNHFVDIDAFDLDFDIRCHGLSEKIYYPVMMEILENCSEFKGEEFEKEVKRAVKNRVKELSPTHITRDDIEATVSYEFNLFYGLGNCDDIDHLGNRRVRAVGELLQNQFRIGLSRMERVVRERMSTQDPDLATPQGLINIRPLVASLKEFFGSSQLSQFMDQNNPLAELTHKRRLSALGPGGLSRDRAGYEVRDVHESHYGRICPIETPEGPNIGLITSLTTYARVDEYGFIETPYRVVKDGVVTREIVYLTADEEDEVIIAQANEPLDEQGHFINDRVSGRGINGENDIYSKDDIEYMDVSPQQIVSVGTAMIPFLENDDATRALMGSNMQRQAVPLLITDAPIVGTGIENKAARDSGVVVIAKNSGIVTKVDSDEIYIKRDLDNVVDKYRLLKFKRSNQGTTINQRPIVHQNDRINKGDIIADGPSTENGEIALGKNILMAFMNWEGYNYEDAMLLNEQLVIDDILTSLHIEEHECEAREIKLGSEEITRDVINIGEDMRKNLDENGIIRVGAEVNSGDILVGKVSPKGETELSAEERLLRAIFGEKAREVRDTSLRVPHGETGIVVDVKCYSRKNGDELPPGVNEVVRVYVATKRKINVGDKMCGRHGNKGVISRIMPREDMPFLPDGTPLQIVLNPLGVPSRMNLGQVLEVHLGHAAKRLGWKVATPVFDGASDTDVLEALDKANLPASGKIKLRDGRTGDEFDNPVTVGYMYMLKLHHLVDEKIHARSIGPYSLVTQQPLGGKAQFGGQRFGEMEVWALEAYGASHTLQEMLTVKSDDIVGRVKTYESIVKGVNIPEPGIPESFKVLMKELQSLCLDVKLIDENGEEIKLKDNIDVPKAKQVLNEQEESKEDLSSLFDDEKTDDEDFDEGFDFSFIEDEKDKNNKNSQDDLFIEEDIDR